MSLQTAFPPQNPVKPQSDGEQIETILILRLSGEAFGLSVSMVHEIMDPIPVTPVPRAPAFAPALINVRGAVVPLVDIRTRLRMEPGRKTDSSRIVVLDAPVEDGPIRLAILADSVDEVIEVRSSDREPIPDLGAPWPAGYLLGVTRHRDGIIVLLNPETLFRPNLGPTQQL